MDELSRVYILPDEQGRITQIDGGYTVSNIADFSKWILIDEGYGDRYNLCQNNYLPKPITDERGVYRYKWDGKKVTERSAAEMEADIPPDMPTQEERIADLEAQNAMLVECLLEISEVIYA